MNIFSKLALWIEHLFHLDKAGKLPDPPSVTGAPVTVPTIDAPAPAAPAPQPVASQTDPAPADGALPEGVIARRGNAVKLAAIEALRNSPPDPLCAQLAEWFIVQDASPDTLETRANLNTARQLLIGNIGVSDPSRWNAQHFEQAIQAIPADNAVGYTVGPQYPDVLSCIGDNLDGKGGVPYRSPRVADFPTLLQNCLADLAAARARHEPDVRLVGYLPIISHAGNGVVA